MNIVKYKHHNKVVSVQKELKGKHREHCLCWQGCKKFTPEDRDNNCYIANHLFGFAVEEDVVTPVWECPLFEQGNLRPDKL